MPTYEYECTACGATFERFQSITENPIRKCPKCGRMKARRLLGAGAGIIFRGSGFYQTDYRSADYKAKAKAEAEASGDGKGSGGKATKAKDSSSNAKKSEN